MAAARPPRKARLTANAWVSESAHKAPSAPSAARARAIRLDSIAINREWPGGTPRCGLGGPGIEPGFNPHGALQIDLFNLGGGQNNFGTSSASLTWNSVLFAIGFTQQVRACSQLQGLSNKASLDLMGHKVRELQVLEHVRARLLKSLRWLFSGSVLTILNLFGRKLRLILIFHLTPSTETWQQGAQNFNGNCSWAQVRGRSRN